MILHYSQLGIVLVALLLGIRHGLDLDHLAMIDSITRRLPVDSPWSRFVGTFFSLGHGIVVILFCILLSYFFHGMKLPLWLGHLMFSLSVLLLLTFGTINICSLFKKQKVTISNKRYLKRLSCVQFTRPWGIMIIGGIFAVSFDTVSQMALFSLNVGVDGALFYQLLLGIIFMLGMIIIDGFNGYVVAYLIRKSTQVSLTLSRIFTLAIGIFSMSIAIYELVHLL